MILNCIGVDDERLALDLLESNISQVPFLKLVGRCKNAFEAMGIMQQQQVDLVFLDAQMPGIHGMKFAESLRGKAGVIILSAYEKYALEGYKVNAIDYLLKPVEFDRFLAAAIKAFEQIGISKQGSHSQPSRMAENQLPVYGAVSPDQALYVHVDYNLVKINLSEIRYIEGYKDYIKVHLMKSNAPVVTRMSLKLLDERLAPHGFIRVHKSFIIPTARITSVQRGLVQLDSIEVPLSEGYRENLMGHIQRNNIL